MRGEGGVRVAGGGRNGEVRAQCFLPSRIRNDVNEALRVLLLSAAMPVISPSSPINGDGGHACMHGRDCKYPQARTCSTVTSQRTFHVRLSTYHHHRHHQLHHLHPPPRGINRHAIDRTTLLDLKILAPLPSGRTVKCKEEGGKPPPLPILDPSDGPVPSRVPSPVLPNPPRPPPHHKRRPHPHSSWPPPTMYRRTGSPRQTAKPSPPPSPTSIRPRSRRHPTRPRRRRSRIRKAGEQQQQKEEPE